MASDLHTKGSDTRVSVTTIEKYVLCPKQYLFSKDDEEPIANPSILKFGTIVHLAVQSPILAILCANKYPFSIAERTPILESIRHASTFKKADAYEMTVEGMVEGLKLVGHIDEVHFDKETKKTVLIDNKTSSVKWDKEDFSMKLQRYMYTYLFHLETGAKDISFIYRVFRKKKRITAEDIMDYKEDMDLEECERKTKEYIINFKKAKETNKYPKNHTKQCFYCKYRKECKEINEAPEKIVIDIDIENKTDIEKEININDIF